MAWMAIVLAGFCEMLFVLFMKLSEGFKKPLFTVASFVIGGLSFYLLSVAMEEIEVGTAYAVWTGIGAAGSVLMGMVFFREPRDRKRLFFLTCVIVGVVGLKTFGGGH